MNNTIKSLSAIILFVFSFSYAQQNETQMLHTFLNDWHAAAAKANFDDYFNAMHEESIFIGTDATEHWTKPEFINYAKPHFDKGKAWHFKVLERHVFFSRDGNYAWFDELLDTQMKLCRGSGVLVKTKTGWKIKHYVLSITIPNENVKEVIKLKKVAENKVINSFKN